MRFFHCFLCAAGRMEIIMPITIAQNAGFCFGVKKAVDIVYEALNNGDRIAILGELIHNRQVTGDLRRRGAITIEDAEDCPGNATLVIRTHGVRQGGKGSGGNPRR